MTKINKPRSKVPVENYIEDMILQDMVSVFTKKVKEHKNSTWVWIVLFLIFIATMITIIIIVFLPILGQDSGFFFANPIERLLDNIAGGFSSRVTWGTISPDPTNRTEYLLYINNILPTIEKIADVYKQVEQAPQSNSLNLSGSLALLTIMGFSIWLGLFISNRRAEEKKLQEIYTHKEVMVKFFLGYEKKIKNLSEKDKEKLFKEHIASLLGILTKDPSDFLASKGDGHPIQALLKRKDIIKIFDKDPSLFWAWALQGKRNLTQALFGKEEAEAEAKSKKRTEITNLNKRQE